jgi:hypothetical protein
MTTKDNEIVALDDWGNGAPEGVVFSKGPQKRSAEFGRAIRIFLEFMHCFRALHFGGPCATDWAREAVGRITEIAMGQFGLCYASQIKRRRFFDKREPA